MSKWLKWDEKAIPINKQFLIWVEAKHSTSRFVLLAKKYQEGQLVVSGHPYPLEIYGWEPISFQVIELPETENTLVNQKIN